MLNFTYQQIWILNIIQRLMKKNSSCKSIRTNITNSTTGFKPIVKKPLQLDIPSYKNQQSPKYDMPMSAKTPPQNALRKKIFSNSKNIGNNENSGVVNNLPLSPTNTFGESNRAYDQLKNKITNLQGRLVEIKRNFQLSFQKRSDKSKLGKENLESTRQKQGSKLLLAKNQEKNNKKDKDNSKKKESKEKEHSLSLKRGTVQLKEEKADSMLQQYVTTFTCQSPTMISHCTSDANLFKPHKLTKEVKPTQKYYISALLSAYSSPKPSSFDQLCKNHLTASMEILHFIKNANKPLPPMPVRKSLPPTQKLTLIFDLDETLIHCNEHASMPCDVLLPIRFPNGTIVKAGVNVRPWARQCLQELSKEYELIVFTASHQCYANVIIDYIDPKRLITHRFFRDSCWRSQQGFYVKDLRIIDRDLKNVLLIDNAAYSYSFQLDNGVPIVPFYDNKADLQLKSLVGYIKSLGNNQNIKQRNASIMRLSEYSSLKDCKDVLTKLYDWQN